MRRRSSDLQAIFNFHFMIWTLIHLIFLLLKDKKRPRPCECGPWSLCLSLNRKHSHDVSQTNQHASLWSGSARFRDHLDSDGSVEIRPVLFPSGVTLTQHSPSWNSLKQGRKNLKVVHHFDRWTRSATRRNVQWPHVDHLQVTPGPAGGDCTGLMFRWFCYGPQGLARPETLKENMK